MTEHWLWTAFVDAVHRNEATIALPPGVYLTVGIVPVSDTPATGDAVWIEAPNSDDCRAWSAKPDHPPTPLPGVTRVDDSGDAFIVHGDRKPTGSVLGLPQPWQVRCRKDQESQPGLLRGVVVE